METNCFIGSGWDFVSEHVVSQGFSPIVSIFKGVLYEGPWFNIPWTVSWAIWIMGAI